MALSLRLAAAPLSSLFGSLISPSCSKPKAVLPDLQLVWQHNLEPSTLSPQLWSLGEVWV